MALDAFKNRPHFTGNAGLSYVAWQLSRRTWHVTPTIRNARGSDMFVTDEGENLKFGVQSKALSSRNSVPLGMKLENLRSEWWIITVHANSNTPTCYIMRLEEVRQLATRDGDGNHWLIPKSYDDPKFKEAWDRLAAEPVIENAEASKIEREKRNGVTKPAEGTITGRLWAIIDEITRDKGAPATRKEILERGEVEGFNMAMTASLYAHWRKFHGLVGTAAPGRQAKPAAPDALPVAPRISG
ncbi:hypothetical protein [Sphingomonas sp. CL5.1]|uniref:hypothetical protein n=1 Tax=Sphingomonas sp. CL5.1 TaxID=2653203 RepID=UPI001C2E6BAE|nr:hypothetical protein [Sphingomonas sp. CL5.1]